MKYVIIGNGTAAVGCIEGIRSVDADGEIIVISAEDRPAYCRPLISYYLENKTDLQRMNYRSDDFYEKNNCKVIYGKTALKIDEKAKGVTLSDKTVISYDKLCVASGSSPFVPYFDGIETVEKKFSFMTVDDALTIEKSVDGKSKVLIIGAGLIGLKCAEGLHGRVKSITVCDLSEHILSSILDKESAGIMQDKLEENGIKFMLGDTAASFDKNTAIMKSGEKIKFDILILAVGVKPNTELLKGIVEINRGIYINEKSETTLPDIYAAGDCTECYDISKEEKRVIAIMPNAYMQGHAAGVNMSGGKESFDKAIPMNSIGFFGLHAMTAGSYDGEMYEEKKPDKLKRLYVKNNRLVGFMLVGETERTGIYTSLIREKTPIDTIDFEMLKKAATNDIFSAETRRQKFGGVV